jgi:hypothetical protein
LKVLHTHIRKPKGIAIPNQGNINKMVMIMINEGITKINAFIDFIELQHAFETIL